MLTFRSIRFVLLDPFLKFGSQITADGAYAPLCTFLETLMTMIWYPCTVATLSRRVRNVIEDFFIKTTDLGLNHFLLDSRLHDFGFRGCTTPDQAIIGGCAHLLNFEGTDTMPAAYYAQVRTTSLIKPYETRNLSFE